MVWAVGVFWLALTASYALFHVALGAPPRGPDVDEEVQRRFEQFADESYWDFLERLFVDRSFGVSPFEGRDTTGRVLDAVGPTIALLVFTFAFATLLAVPLGVVWGRRRPTNRLFRTASALVYGLSFFSLGLLLVYWVGHKASLLPLGGYCDLVDPATSCGGLSDWGRALILPGLAFGAFFASVYVRLVHALVRNAKAAEARGEERARRRALLSYAKLLGRDFGVGIGLCIFVEALFGIPGLGVTMLQAYETFDAPRMEGVVITATALAMAVNLTVDVGVATADSSFRRF